MPTATHSVLATSLLALLAGTMPSPAPAAAPVLPGTIVDLTHAFDAQTIYWPTAGRFELESVAHGMTDIVVAALPMKIRGGTGGPLRIIAWW